MREQKSCAIAGVAWAGPKPVEISMSGRWQAFAAARALMLRGGAGREQAACRWRRDKREAAQR